MEQEIRNFHQRNQVKKLILGLLVVAVGIVLLGTNFGWIDPLLKRILFSWPMILIVVGIFQLGHRNYFPSFILLGIGTFFLLPEIARFYPQLFPGIGTNFAAAYWPLLLIFAGVFILLQFIFPNKWQKYNHKCHRDWEKKWDARNENNANNEYIGNNNGFESFKKNVVFGSVEHIFLDEFFTGGEINAVFGGVTLDLRKTNLAEGNTYLEINSVFGGVTLFVPTEWNVVTKFDSVFGGFADKRILQEPTDKNRRLIIKGSCVFGGGEIR